MTKDKVASIGTMIGLAALAAALIVHGWIFTPLIEVVPAIWTALNKVDVHVERWINLLTALGTLSAVATALWLAQKNERNEREQKQLRAGLAAASVGARLSVTAKMVDELHLNCVFLPAGADKLLSPRDRAVLLIRKRLQLPYFKPDEATLMAMAPLPQNCAQRIARAFDYLERVRLQVEGLPHGLLNEVTNPYQREWFFQSWSSDIAKAEELLTVAMRVCDAASDIGAPMPTHIERHGEYFDDDV